MSSRPLPSTIRPTDTQFVSDLTQVFRRHKVPCGQPSDIDHLDVDLEANRALRADLFSLCNAISHLSAEDLSPRELLLLVARAITGNRAQPHLVDIPAAAVAIFLHEYETWATRAFGLDPCEPPVADTQTTWQAKPNPFSTAASLASASIDVNSPVPAESHGDVSLNPETPIGRFTLGELKSYLDDIEQRVSRLQPFLDAVSKPEPLPPADISRRPIPESQHFDHPIPFLPAPPTIPVQLSPKATTDQVTEHVPLPADAVRPDPEPMLPPEERPTDHRLKILKGIRPVSSWTPPTAGWNEPTPGWTEQVVFRPSPPLARSRSACEESFLPPLVVPARPALEAPRIPARMFVAVAAFCVLIVASTVVGMRMLDRQPEGTPSTANSVQQAPVIATPAPKPGTQTLSGRRSAGSGRSAHGAKSSAAADLLTIPVTSSSGGAGGAKPLVISGSIPMQADIAHSTRPPAPASPEDHATGSSTPASNQTTNPAPTQSTTTNVAQPSTVPAPVSQSAPQRTAPEPASALTSTTVSSAAPRPNVPSATAAPIVRSAGHAEQPISVPSPTLMTYAITTPQPTYPDFRRPVADTSVVVQGTVGKDGRVISARALSGPLYLTGAAVQAMQKWRFRPYLVNGTPVEVITNVNFLFKAQ
jgi:protein TonB